MFNLAIQAGKLIQKPYIPFLQEHNVRVGIFEREQFLAVLAHLPEAGRAATTFAYITGSIREKPRTERGVRSDDARAARNA